MLLQHSRSAMNYIKRFLYHFALRVSSKKKGPTIFSMTLHTRHLHLSSVGATVFYDKHRDIWHSKSCCFGYFCSQSNGTMPHQKKLSPKCEPLCAQNDEISGSILVISLCGAQEAYEFEFDIFINLTVLWHSEC